MVLDPFPAANGVAVLATTKKDSRIGVLRILVTVLQSARRAVGVGRLGPIHLPSAIAERGDKSSMDKLRDQDRGKGPMEQY